MPLGVLLLIYHNCEGLHGLSIVHMLKYLKPNAPAITIKRRFITFYTVIQSDGTCMYIRGQ